MSQQTVDSAQKSVRLTRLRLEGGIAPRTDLSQAEADPVPGPGEPRAAAHAGGAGRQRVAAAGRSADRSGPSTGLNRRGVAATVAELPEGSNSYVLLRRPDVLQAEYPAARGQRGHRRRARGAFPTDHADRLAGLRKHRAHEPFDRRRIRLVSAAPTPSYTIFSAGAGHANVRLTEAQRNAALATYQSTIQTAFREVVRCAGAARDDG